MKTLPKAELKTEQEEEIEGIPICASNLTTLVTDGTNFVTEIHYRIGSRSYIENAD